MDSNLKKSIILEHYQHPKNRGLTNDIKYLKSNTNSESCIDEIDLEVLIEDNLIKDIHFDGEACAICTSSTSIMIDTLIDKDINTANEILNNFCKMIDEKEYNESILEQAVVYDDIYKQPSRKKCATLPFQTLEKTLKIYEECVKDEK